MKVKLNCLSYDEAKKLIKKNGVTNRTEYRAFRSKSAENKELLPYDYENYWGLDFVSNADFFNTEKYSYDKLLSVCKKNKLSTKEVYRAFKKHSKIHGPHMPFEPTNAHYAEWKGWKEFFNEVNG